MATLLDKYYNVRIKLRNDSYTNWRKQEDSFRPYDGEVIIYDVPTAEELKTFGLKGLNYQLIKIGDGVRALGELPFINNVVSQIATGSINGSISVLGEDIFVKGLEPSQHDIIMAFQPIANFYSKVEVNNLIKEEQDARIAAINAEAKTRAAADTALEKKITDTQANIEQNIEVKLTEVRNDFYDFKDETEEALAQAVANGVVTLDNPSSLVYNLKQGGQLVGTINIPKDLFVKSGKIVVNPEGFDAGTYIELILQNQEQPIYINVGSLVDIYTHEQNAIQIQIKIDNNTRIISASIVPNSITSTEIKDASIIQAKLSTSIQEILNMAEEQLSDGEGSINQRFEELKEYIDEKIAEGEETDISNLAKIATTGNVNDLVQDEGDYLILNCN